MVRVRLSDALARAEATHYTMTHVRKLAPCPQCDGAGLHKAKCSAYEDREMARLRGNTAWMAAQQKEAIAAIREAILA